LLNLEKIGVLVFETKALLQRGGDGLKSGSSSRLPNEAILFRSKAFMILRHSNIAAQFDTVSGEEVHAAV